MSYAFAYESCDIPDGMRLEEWRHSHAAPRRHRWLALRRRGRA